MANWTRNDGLEQSAPLTVYCNNRPNQYWPDATHPVDGCVRNIGSTKGNQFVCFPMGILRDGVTLQARRAVQFEVIDPLAGTPVARHALAAHEKVTLPRGPGAYVCVGRSLSE